MAAVYFMLNLVDFAAFPVQSLALNDILSLPLEVCVVLGATSFAIGYRFASRRFWIAISVLYAADWLPSIVGITFRLARHAVNDRYVIYSSPMSYLITIFCIVFSLLSLARLIDSFKQSQSLASIFA
jgi:hypothetical protein